MVHEPSLHSLVPTRSVRNLSCAILQLLPNKVVISDPNIKKPGKLTKDLYIMHPQGLSLLYAVRDHSAELLAINYIWVVILNYFHLPAALRSH